MGLRRAAVPAGDRFAVVIEDRFDGVPVQDRVAAFDVIELADDRFGQLFVAPRAEMPELPGIQPCMRRGIPKLMQLKSPWIRVLTFTASQTAKRRL